MQIRKISKYYTSIRVSFILQAIGHTWLWVSCSLKVVGCQTLIDMNAQICYFLMLLAKVPKTLLEVDHLDVRSGFLTCSPLAESFTILIININLGLKEREADSFY